MFPFKARSRAEKSHKILEFDNVGSGTWVAIYSFHPLYRPWNLKKFLAFFSPYSLWELEKFVLPPPPVYELSLSPYSSGISRIHTSLLIYRPWDLEISSSCSTCRFWDLEKFQALLVYLSFGTWKNSELPPLLHACSGTSLYKGRGTWKNSQFFPYMTWKCSKFFFYTWAKGLWKSLSSLLYLWELELT